MSRPPVRKNGVSREELASRIISIYAKKEKGEPLSKAEERVFAYHETCVECRCKR